jgi:glycosyltransferase involved in cell wall biosynthesis
VRVLAMVPYPAGQAPSQRFRIEQWMPHLRALGIDCDLASFMDSELYERLARPGDPGRKAAGLLRATVRRWRTLAETGAYDLVFLHREAMVFGPAVIERIIARRKPVVFDFDDSIWLRNENRVNPLAAWVKCPGKTRAIARRASAILAGNAYLAEWARDYNRSTYIVPTTIDTEGGYNRQKIHGPTKVPVIGWSGTTSTLRYLEFLRPVLEDLARRRPFRLRAICDGPAVRWPGLDMDWRSWSSAREVDDLIPFDIGLMPQPNEDWAKGKCGAKALQYMALGIPPVASRNGVLPEIVEEGRSGFLADSPGEWVQRLEELLDDWKLRAAMGEQARSTVQERYSASAHVPRIAHILRSAAGFGGEM